MAMRKIFVGSLPPAITGELLRDVFGKYGTVEEIYIKPDCEPGRQWAFVTFSSPEEAQYAKECCDRQVTFPGGHQPCDVMLAKTRAGKGGGGGGQYMPPPVYSQGGAFNQPASNGRGAPAVVQPGVAAAARKVFVGSLPGNVTEDMLRAEFAKFGRVEDIFIKPNCETGRQWAFVHFSSPEEANYAAQTANGVVTFPGCIKPCEVTLARNQGMFGQEPLMSPAPQVVAPDPYVARAAPTEPMGAPRKIFVGSLPDGITDPALRAEFSKFGTIVDLYMKNNCEPGRHWAFITYASHEEALYAKESCDRVLQFPGADRPCEVTIARHQGMFGKDAIDTTYGGSKAPIQYTAGGNYSTSGAPHFPTPAPSLIEGPRKIFVGSLPDGIDDQVLRAEFSKYGQIVDLFVKHDTSERNRHWAFVTFATADQAAFAKESTDRVLLLPNADRPCEVMLAKNQGKFGQAPLINFTGGGGAQAPVVVPPMHQVAAAIPEAPADEAQPPPPSAPPPPHLTAWRMFRTASGIPYYHNSTTGITQWECPPDLQVPGQRPGESPAYSPETDGQARYSPY
mmetsp:Transcript_1908/g.6092  ORF Transcript_1908/g.6092 Transcript_1908/m.6092 type:complete len:565 (+) Transcript_1908:110-1804(+)